MGMMFRGFLGLTVVLLSTSDAYTLDLLDLQNQSTSSLSLSGASTAIANDLSAVSLNPAGISRHSETRIVGFENRYFKKGRNWAMAGGVIDGITEDPLHWAFHLNTVHTKDLEMDQYSLATSYNYEDFFMVGITHRLTKFHEPPMMNDGLYFSMGVGALAFVSDHISAGVASQNLIRSERYGSLLPARLTAGVAGNFLKLRTDFDLERNFSQETWTFKLGTEYKPSDAIVIRAGWNQNLTHEDKGYSLGNSVHILDRLNLDFGFLDQLNSSNITFSGGVSVKI